MQITNKGVQLTQTSSGFAPNLRQYSIKFGVIILMNCYLKTRSQRIVFSKNSKLFTPNQFKGSSGFTNPNQVI